MNQPLAPGGYNFFENVWEGMDEPPPGIVRHHFSQVAVIADMISAAGLIDVSISLLLAGVTFGNLEGFKIAREDLAC
jgi:hypothetical protein